jgi:EAL domain-containing protein (putative c-di-GMP-specific phosphodiesterase class I)
MPGIDAPLRPQLNVVMLGSDPAWIAAVRMQAAHLGLARVHVAHTPEDVVPLLSGGHPPVTHLLMQPSSAGDMLPELIDLTIDQALGVVLVLLGDPALLDQFLLSQAATHVPHPSPDWLHSVLSERFVRPRAKTDAERPTLAELQEALDSARIVTRYQPVVRLDTGAPVSLEVLARLEHKTRGILLPDLFVPSIEEAGLAWPFTQAVITRAFADWSEGKLGGFGLGLALNFPLDVLLIPDALSWLEERRREVAMPAHRVTIELTESRPVTEIDQLRHAITTLRGMGYQLAIDDVGPELRDHRELLDLPFTALKLDKNLVRESPDSASAAEFLATTIESARAANLTIIAEGVEDAEIWRRMRQLGVDEAQGFLIARPLPVSAVALWHKDWCARLDY